MPKHGINCTLKVFDSLGELAVQGITLGKTFSGTHGVFGMIGAAGKLSAIGVSITQLIATLPCALPELLDLDNEEAQKLGQASYQLVLKVMMAAKV